jgi:hypothetical protein
MPCWPLVLPLLLSTVQAVARRVAYQTFNHGTPTYHLGHAAMHPLQSCLAAVWLVLVLACLPPGFSPPVHGPCMPHGCLQVQHVELHGMCQFVLGGLCVGVSVPSVDGDGGLCASTCAFTWMLLCLLCSSGAGHNIPHEQAHRATQQNPGERYAWDGWSVGGSGWFPGIVRCLCVYLSMSLQYICL